MGGETEIGGIGEIGGTVIVAETTMTGKGTEEIGIERDRETETEIGETERRETEKITERRKRNLTLRNPLTRKRFRLQHLLIVAPVPREISLNLLTIDLRVLPRLT